MRQYAGPGDANFDNAIDDDDLSLLRANRTGPLADGKAWEQGDFTGEGRVSDDDLSVLLANWTGSSAVPEPATVGVVLGGAAIVLLGKSRRT